MLRLYAPGFPPAWDQLQREYGVRSSVVSFKMNPVATASGLYDERLRSWFLEAPKHRETWWIYYHEPEDNVEAGQFTASEFQAAWMHVAQLAASVENPRLHATVVLMCYTLKPTSGREVARVRTSGRKRGRLGLGLL
ncbi:MAG: hypothetical protein WKF82_10835 [Nocardioidaceae bacterium]